MSITKREYGGKTRYHVRVMRNGVTHSRTFSNQQKAKQFERQLLEQLGPPASQKGIPKNRPRSNTGIGRIVRRIFKRHGRQPVDVFTVYYRTPEGQPRYTNISISRWGERKALQLAKRKKREMDAIQLGKK